MRAAGSATARTRVPRKKVWGLLAQTGLEKGRYLVGAERSDNLGTPVRAGRFRVRPLNPDPGIE